MSEQTSTPVASVIKVKDRVTGEAGVFHPDRAASGSVVAFAVKGTLVQVKLDDGEVCFVPVSSVHLA